MGRRAVRLGAVPQIEPAVRPDFRNITVMARKLVQDAEASRHGGTSAPSLLWRGRGEYDDCPIRTIETSGSQHERELEPGSLRQGPHLQDRPSESGNRQRDCSDPQTAVVVNHQDRPG